jgi:hypothetical protein
MPIKHAPATTVQQHLARLPPDRREALEAVRKTILQNLPKGYEEGIQYGVIGYYVPHSVYPPGYHCDPEQPLPFAGLASQKNHMAVYLMCVYADPDKEAWFRKAWRETGNKLDMGKSCVRFKKIEDVPLKVISEVIRRAPSKQFIERYESVIQQTADRRAKTTAKKKVVTKKSPAKKRSAKKRRGTKKRAPNKKGVAG